MLGLVNLWDILCTIIWLCYLNEMSCFWLGTEMKSLILCVYYAEVSVNESWVSGTKFVSTASPDFSTSVSCCKLLVPSYWVESSFWWLWVGGNQNITWKRNPFLIWTTCIKHIIIFSWHRYLPTWVKEKRRRKKLFFNNNYCKH